MHPCIFKEMHRYVDTILWNVVNPIYAQNRFYNKDPETLNKMQLLYIMDKLYDLGQHSYSMYH